MTQCKLLKLFSLWIICFILSVAEKEDEHTSVRLSDGSGPHEGRVEIYYNGSWGTVCDTSLKENIAVVICRMLNFPTRGVMVVWGASFENETDNIWLDGVECVGNETDLAYCQHSGWGNVNCNHTEDISVKCKGNVETTVRLTGGDRPYEGLVEVYYNGTWGTICDDDFDSSDAAVVCIMLHFPTRGAIAKNSGAFANRTGTIWLDDVDCFGYEADIANCTHGRWGVFNCSHAEDVSVICSVPYYPNETVRLVNGNSLSEGRVEVFHGNQWGTVCDDNFDDNAATVVCTMLGLPSDDARPMINASFGQGSGVIWLDELRCYGNESDIESCRHSNWGVSDCSHSEDAGVYCDDVQIGVLPSPDSMCVQKENMELRCYNESNPKANEHTPVRLSGGLGPYEGLVEVFYNGSWGTICDDLFDSNDASVICRMLNFPTRNATAKGEASFGNVTGTIWLDNVGCVGTEADIAYCRHSDWGNVNCDHTEDVSVICPANGQTTIRLIGGETPYEGRVEVYYNGKWGTVCNDFFDSRDAAVVCRMLSLPTRGAVALRNNDFGYGTGIIWMDNMDCDGNETDLADCRHNDWGVSNCGHSEDVAVLCSVPFYPNETVRLVNGNSSSEGRVEVFHGNQWGTVCDDNFDDNAATVVCAMLGLPSSGAQSRKKAFYGQGTGVIWLDNVRCSGNESDIQFCRHSNWAVSNCDHSEDAVVICTEENTTILDEVKDKFQLSVCSQGDDMKTSCKKVPTNTDMNTEKSLWPPGPYALPMSVYGCPEDSSQGWQEGYLALTFKNPDLHFSYKRKNDIGNENNETASEGDGLFWPDQNIFVFAPFSQDSLEIHFCFKTRRNKRMDIGQFPVGNYSIFTDRSGCKDEFVAAEYNIIFPVIDHWTSDGKLPLFSINETEDHAILTLALCKRTFYQPNAQVPLHPSSEFNTPFVYIQNIDAACPVFAKRSGHLEKEELFMSTDMVANRTTEARVFAYCYNYPKTWKHPDVNVLYNEYIEKAFTLSQVYVTDGNKSSQSLPGRAFGHIVSASSFGDLVVDQIYIPWKNIDLGRTYVLTAIKFHLMKATILNSDTAPVPFCFISQEKWSFLYHRSLQCPLVPQYKTEEQVINILFLRPVRGRYITLIGRSSDHDLMKHISVDLFTNKVHYDDVTGCNIDLGMTSGRIQHSQINSSSFQSDFYPWEARPYHKGWCADDNDNNPYIIVNFRKSTWLESITVWNWAIFEESNKNIAFPRFYTLGVTEFVITYGDDRTTGTEYGVNFRIETYRRDAEQSTFWFRKPFAARYLKLHIRRSYTDGINCIKFELHGCTGITSTSSLFRESVTVTNLKYVYGNGLIASPGYPDVYLNGPDYNWVINADTESFVVLIFTSISLLNQNSQTSNDCTDKILISRYMLQKETATTIDYRLNSQVFIVETKESLAFLSFITCLLQEIRPTGHNGFEVIVSSQSIPSCFSLDSSASFETRRSEVCRLPSMNIKSMSYLGLTFLGTVEEWTIESVRKQIKMYIKDFRVPCLTDGLGSEFSIAESGYKSSYCNLNRPPDIFYSQSDTVKITFRKQEELPYLRYTVGFWIEYSLVHVSLERLIYFQASVSELTNIAVQKPAEMSIADVNTPSLASYGNDGLSSSFSTADWYLPWWLVDLQDVYRLEFAVLIYRLVTLKENSKILGRTLRIYTGFQQHSLSLTSYHCGDTRQVETIPLHSLHSRYFKIERVGPRSRIFRFMEIEVYGVKDHNINESVINFHINRAKEKTSCQGPDIGNPDYSSWSVWSECSVKCGIGVKQRKRNCLKIPATSCLGEDTDLQKCVGNGDCPVCVRKFKKCYSFFPELTNWEHAGFECWRRYMSLVSINSLEELRFIKYKLRDRRQRELSVALQSAAKNVNASYFAHIGFQRINASFANNTFFWEDLSPVIFTAWKIGEPKAGSCVKINYRYHEPDNTWETEECKQDLADYFVCERPIDSRENRSVIGNEEVSRYPKYDNDWKEVYEQIRTSQYTGTLNVTSDGTDCLPWSIYSMNSWFPEGVDKVKNYCRDPNENGLLWCYVDGPYYGGSKTCEEILPATKNPSFSLLRYSGKWSRTYSGRQCDIWKTRSTFEDSDFPGETVSMVSNHCRDPYNYGYLWCYTTDPNYDWEPCVLPETSTNRCADILHGYTGQHNTSYSENVCHIWHYMSSSLTKSLESPQFPDASTSDAENYCRDPFQDGYLWCFTDENGTEWEPCSVKDIHDFSTYTITNNSSVFQCENGDVVPLDNKCDNKFDCNDFTDETECWLHYKNHKLFQKDSIYKHWPGHLELSSYFQCGSLEWISVIARCDSIKDCADASDEIRCHSYLKEQAKCGSDEFACGNGDCIHISQVCNYVVDCLDASDEYCDKGTCQANEYQCDNGECINSDERCDGFEHCLDGTDEGNCDACNTQKSIHCDVVKCIPTQLVCDTYVDCEDGSDEGDTGLCYTEGLTSCQAWWNAGHRKSGIYKLRGVDVMCNFDSVISDGWLYTTIMNRDLYWMGFSIAIFPQFSYRAYTYARSGFEIDDDDLNKILRIKRDTCAQQTEQTCSPVHKAIIEYDNDFYRQTFNSCSCETKVIDCIFRCSRIDECEKGQHTSLFTKYSSSMHGGQIASIDSAYTDQYEIIPRPIKCSHRFYPDTNLLVCEGDTKIIPSYLRCIYDIDSAGNMIGCRSASHLKTCETFQCPQNTVKCPGTYCVPLKFVCDGKIQCPGGEDEEDCRCNMTENEVVILIGKQFMTENKRLVQGFAKQFSTETNNVRILSYETFTPLLTFGIDSRILKIYDTQIQPFIAVNRYDTCQYNIMAEYVLSTIKFKTAYSKGIIFMETDSEAAGVASAIFSHSAKGLPFGIHLYRLVERPYTPRETHNTFDNVDDISVPRWKMLTDIGATFFPELCKGYYKTNCSNGYRCLSSKVCIPLLMVCDGERQCVHGDDEQLCDFMCPENCTCSGFAVNCSNQNLDIEQIATIPMTIRQLDISLNEQLSIILQQPYLDMKFLIRLNVSHCSIREVSMTAFYKANNIIVLDLSFNHLTVLHPHMFGKLVFLTNLYMRGSYKLVTIEPGAFKGLSSVDELRLVDTGIRKISAYTFTGMTLKSIDFSNNSISIIEDFAFDGLSAEMINFELNPVKDLNRKIFAGVRDVKQLKTPAFKFCCIRPTYMVEEDCSPSKDEFSSCEDLMRLSALQTMLWLVGASALIGNFFSIVYRLKFDRERLKLGYGIFVTNLAAADFLMGMYLIIIAIADALYRKIYIYEDEYWRNSGWCTFAGILSTVSSEASVLFLCLITLDRLFVIKFPFGQIRFDSVKAHLCSVAAWFFSIFISLFPIMYESYFQNKFYSRSGVCIALPLTRDRSPGWLYSVVVFIGLNFVTFVLVAIGQVSIFMEVRKASSRMKKMQSARRKDLTVARNLLLVVTTDFMCWFPIGVMGLMALNGHVISGDVYAWTAVFILPVNSALNPILYTLSAIIGKTKFTPSTEEQSRTELSKELGNYTKQYQSISGLFNPRVAPRQGYRTVSSVSDSNAVLSAPIALKLTFKLFRCLDVLHRASLVVGNIDKSTVFVTQMDGKLTGDLRFKAIPEVINKDEEMRNDILQTGKVINTLIQKYRKQVKSN